MILSIRLNDKDAELIRKYAGAKGMTVSALVRQSVLKRIKDEHDLAAYEKAIQEYRRDPTVYTLGEVEAELNKPQNSEHPGRAK